MVINQLQRQTKAVYDRKKDAKVWFATITKMKKEIETSANLLTTYKQEEKQRKRVGRKRQKLKRS